MKQPLDQRLIESAKVGMGNAYTPVSDFPVGAAVLTSKGNIYQGCNTESVIAGLGTCAERSAIDHAVACGEYCFEQIAVISGFEDPISPCGACLQYIAEFSQVAGHDIEILMVGSDGKTRRSSISAMLDSVFGPEQLGLNIEKYRD